MSCCRFQTTFLGSRAMAGSLLRSGMLRAQDKDGRSLSDVLFMHGFDGSDAAVGQIALRREAVKGCAGSFYRCLSRSGSRAVSAGLAVIPATELYDHRVEGTPRAPHSAVVLSGCACCKHAGGSSEAARVKSNARPYPPARSHARYVEVHMEQGPVLDELGVPLAPVSAIAGQTRLSVSVTGSQARDAPCVHSLC